jgi:16S rRNA (guanine527-N7)-methyltransferase
VSVLDAQLRAGAEALEVELSDAQLAQFGRLVGQLVKWNKAYNLTAITDPEQILTHHLLDSIAAQSDLAGTRIADVGTGAGFPGLPLAIVDPARQFTLIDSAGKKLRFVDHASRQLGLTNVRTWHGRAEQYRGDVFDTVITRAFAPLPRLASWVTPLVGPATRVIAMKGHWPPAADEPDAAALPAGWRIETVRAVAVPGLAEARHHVLLRRDARAALA